MCKVNIAAFDRRILPQGNRYERPRWIYLACYASAKRVKYLRLGGYSGMLFSVLHLTNTLL